jgi:hypothetical protein
MQDLLQGESWLVHELEVDDQWIHAHGRWVRVSMALREVPRKVLIFRFCAIYRQSLEAADGYR